MDHNNTNINTQKHFLRKSNIKRVLILKLLVIIIAISSSTLAFSKPNKHFNDSILSQVTVLDLFMSQLYNSTKCDFWYGYEKFTPVKVNCMNKPPKYNSKEKTIELSFIFSLLNNDQYYVDYKKTFDSASKLRKEEMLTEEVDHLLYNLGLSKGHFDTKNVSNIVYEQGYIDLILEAENVNKSMIRKFKEMITLKIIFFYGKPNYSADRDTKGNTIIKPIMSEIIYP